MKHIPEIGDTITLKKFAFTNKSGGTGMSDREFGEKFSGDAVVYVTKAWHDYETGWRYHGNPISVELCEYMKRNAKRFSPVYFGQFDI